MVRLGRRALLLSALCVPASPYTAVRAQPLTEMRFEASSSVEHASSGQVTACWLRVVGVEMVLLHPPLGRTVDVSLGFEASGRARVKALSHEMDPLSPHGAQARRIEVVQAWFHAPGADRTAPLDGGSIDRAADAGAFQYVSKLEPALAVVAAIDADADIQVVLQRAGEATQRVYYGRVGIATFDRKRLRDCVGQLKRSAQKAGPDARIR